MKFKKEIFQILISIVLTALLFTSFSWIVIHYQDPNGSVKEALSIAVSFMSVLATIFAALIAVLLFNDWRHQQKHQNAARFGEIALKSYKNYEKKLEKFFDEISITQDELKYCCEELSDETEGNYNELTDEDKDEDEDEDEDEDYYDELRDLASLVQDLFYEFHDDFVMYLYVAFPQDKNQKLILPTEVDHYLESLSEKMTNLFEILSKLDETESFQSNLYVINEISQTELENETENFFNIIRDTILKPLKLEE